MIVLEGVFIGGIVCVFGMWAFLKGQRCMMQIQNGAVPDDLIHFERRKAGPGEKETGEPDLAEQFRSMFEDEATGKEAD